MYTIDKRDRVRELTDVALPSSSAPDPLVLADESTIVVTYISAMPSTRRVRGLEMRNRGHPRHDPGLFQHLRHWVWTFQDSVLECAALSYAALEARERPDDLLSRMHALLRSS